MKMGNWWIVSSEEALSEWPMAPNGQEASYDLNAYRSFDPRGIEEGNGAMRCFMLAANIFWLALPHLLRSLLLTRLTLVWCSPCLDRSDGDNPEGALVEDSGGHLYARRYQAAAAAEPVFQTGPPTAPNRCFIPSRVEATGSEPSGLIMDEAGNLYGTTR